MSPRWQPLLNLTLTHRPGRRNKPSDLPPMPPVVDRSFGSSGHDVGNISYGAEPEGGLTLSGDIPHFPPGSGEPLKV